MAITTIELSLFSCVFQNEQSRACFIDSPFHFCPQISYFLGYIFKGRKPSWTTILGAAFIVVSVLGVTLYSIVDEKRRKDDDDEDGGDDDHDGDDGDNYDGDGYDGDDYEGDRIEVEERKPLIGGKES